MALTYAELAKANDELLALLSKKNRIIAGLRKLLAESRKAKNLLATKPKRGKEAASVA